MNPIFDWFFAQYQGVPTHLVVLEIIGVVFGFLSVWFAKKENIWVYPTGIVSTVIFVYILWEFQLLGDMLINGYYTTMSIYGWWVWTRKTDDTQQHIPITWATKKQWQWSVLIFIATMAFVAVVYTYFEKWDSYAAYVDTVTTAIFFVGMWFMAKKKVENWIFWIVGDVISVPLYAYKGLMFTSFQYFLFTIIAYYGYLEWKQRSVSSQQA